MNRRAKNVAVVQMLGFLFVLLIILFRLENLSFASSKADVYFHHFTILELIPESTFIISGKVDKVNEWTEIRVEKIIKGEIREKSVPVYSYQVKDSAGTTYKGIFQLGEQVLLFLTRRNAEGYELAAGFQGKILLAGENEKDYLEAVQALLGIAVLDNKREKMHEVFRLLKNGENKYLTESLLREISSPDSKYQEFDEYPLLLAELMKNKNPYIRQVGVTNLVNIGDKRITSALLEALQDEDKIVRERAVSALRRIKDQRILPALIKMLNDPERNVRENVSFVLDQMQFAKRKIENPSFLIQAIKDNNPRIRAAAAGFSYNLPPEKAVPLLIELVKDEDKTVIMNAASSIGILKKKSRDPEVAGPLAKLLSDKDETVRKEVIRALHNIYLYSGPIPALKNPVNDEIFFALVKTLDDSSTNIKYQAIQIMGQIGITDSRAEKYLIPMLKDSDRDTRLSVLISLQKIANPQLLPLLEKASREDEDLIVRQSAERTIKHIRWLEEFTRQEVIP